MPLNLKDEWKRLHLVRTFKFFFSWGMCCVPHKDVTADMLCLSLTEISFGYRLTAVLIIPGNCFSFTIRSPNVYSCSLFHFFLTCFKAEKQSLITLRVFLPLCHWFSGTEYINIDYLYASKALILDVVIESAGKAIYSPLNVGLMRVILLH